MKYTISGPFRTKLDGKDYVVAGRITVEQDDPQPISEETDVKYLLKYTKLDGETQDYYIKEIVEMDSHLMRCVVSRKGYRSFISSRINKLISINNQ